MALIFWDIDGCTRIAMGENGTDPQMLGHLCKNLRELTITTGSQLVLSSQWRFDLPIEDIVRNHGLPMRLLHPDQLSLKIPKRSDAIIAWLAQHPGVDNFAIIDDNARDFDDSPDELKRRLVLCNSRVGLVASVVEKVRRLLEGMSDDDRTLFNGGDPTNDSDL